MVSDKQMKDSGFVIYSEKLGCFYTGFGWNGQLRNAKTYHLKSKAQDIVDRYPNEECLIYQINISLEQCW